jgi:cell division protein FtsW
LEGEVRSKTKKAPRGQIDLTFLVLTLLILSIGLVMLFSASYANAYYLMGNSLHYISRQFIFAIAGVVVMLAASHADYRLFKPLAIPIYGISIVLLIVVLFMPPLNNARRWIPLGFGTLQPSEIAKFAIVVLFSALISANCQQMHTFRHGILPFMMVLLPVIGLMILEPHLSGTILIVAIGAAMMLAGGTSLRWFVMAGGAIACLIIVLVMIPGVVEYAGSRIEHWLNPFSDPRGEGFQTIQSLYAIGSGGLMGTGIGNSRQKYLYLPEPQNDFIFAIVCEELGFVGAALIICLYALLIWRGFVIAMRCRERFGSMLALGLISQVGIQTILNIAVVTNTIPNTGISLPFFSYGGTALTLLLAQMGVILSISRQTSLEKE